MELLETNPFCSELQRLGKIVHQTGNTNQVANIQAQINQETNAFEVGVLVSHDNHGELVYSYKLNGQSIKLPLHCDQLEALLYPLLFLHGEKGWSKNIEKNISYLPYLASRLLMPEHENSSQSGWLEKENKNGVMIRTNRFQLMSRLMQHYVVEGLSRLIDTHLSFIKANKGFILYDNSNDTESGDPVLNPQEVDADREEFNSSSKTFLNDSIHGSPRHLKALAKNCLQIVAEKGKPHGFLTLTANPEWPEIVDKLLNGQTAYDR